jgi:hypothetical protein
VALAGAGAPGCAGMGDETHEARTSVAEVPAPPPPPAPEPSGPRVTGVTNSTDRVLFWTGCDQLARMSDRDLNAWRRRGVDGFVCMTQQLRSLGGKNAFAGGGRPPARPAYALERRLRRSRIAQRARRRGIVLYMGFYAANANRRAKTPFLDWFDDAGWSRRVLRDVRRLAGSADALGFRGVAIDQELYGAPRASWDWSYPGNRRPQRAVRRAVERRGAQTMGTLTSAFPGVEVIAYYTHLPDSWEERVQDQVNGRRNAFARRVQVDFWGGMTRVRGYRRVVLADAIFYKTTHIAGDDWATALRTNAGSLYALFSRRWRGWPYAADRVDVAPFAWIDAGPSEFERARDPDYTAAQLEAFRRYGAGRMLINYAYAPLRDFDYGPHAAGLRAASKPGQVDFSPPQIKVTARGPGRIAGTAADDSAIRVVRWRTADGASGTARLVPDATVPGRVTWSARVPPGGPVTVHAEDIKGLSSRTEFRTRR